MAEDLRNVELLAPAGSLECLHAAVTAGADAVYLGLDEFNARRNAQNLTLDTLQDACDYAHLRGVRVYVAMNIQILPGELDRAVETALQAYARGADALIVQDIGLAAEVHRAQPQIPLHASTQMNIHNAAGVEFAAALGLERVTFARELSLAEVRELTAVARDLGLETECFIHGALCVCYSGQCLMSSMIGGRSANRGLCAQPCRLPYELHRDDREGALPCAGEHLLSPRDLCGAELARELAEAGVASLKIEGRMKSADYVQESVAVYREVLDGAGRVTDAHRSRLDEAFSRGFTTGYLEGNRGNEAMGYERPNNRGVFAGRVQDVRNGTARLKAELGLNEGDVLEFWTGKGNVTATVEAPCAAGRIAEVPCGREVRKGDRAFRVRNARTRFMDQPLEPRIAVTGELELRKGQPAHLTFRTRDGVTAEAWGDAVESARTKALDEADVRDHVNRLGQTPFSLADEDLAVTMDDGIGMGFSQLHHLRAEALELLQQELLAPYEREEAQSYRFKGQGQGGSAARKLELCAWATNPGTARAARRAGADAVYVPLLNFRRGQGQLAGARTGQAEQAGYPKQCVMALPVIDHDPTEGTREERSGFDPWEYVREGKPVFADNIGDLWRALQLGAEVEAGPHIPLTNQASLEALARIGVSRVWLSPELSLGQIQALAEYAPLELGIFISGAQELMVTEHCTLMAQGPCAEQCETCPRREARHHLTDRKGFEFPVVTDMMGRSHIYNGVEFDGIPSLCDFQAMGIGAVMVDTTLWDKKTAEAAVKRAARGREACKEGRTLEKRPGTTTGHLFRGVQ